MQAWRVCGAEGCVGGPTGKAWNVKIRAWKLGVTLGLHALRSRKVGGYGRKKQEMGEEAVRTWRGVGESSRGEGGGTGWGFDSTWCPSFSPGLPKQSPSSPLHSGCLGCLRPSSLQPCTPGEALSPLFALFSFQEGSGSSGPWVGHSLAWLTVPRFLVIPGGRAGISNQSWRGAESFSGTL